MLTLPPEVAAANAGLVADIDALIAEHGSERSALIPVLQGLRARRREISDVAMQVVADRLGTTPVQVQGVVSFYHFLGTEPTGTHVIHLCRTLSCELAGTRRVAAALEEAAGATFGHTSPDGEVALEWANCIGLCDTPPGMLVDRDAVGHADPATAAAIVTDLRAGATPGDR